MRDINQPWYLKPLRNTPEGPGVFLNAPNSRNLCMCFPTFA